MGRWVEARAGKGSPKARVVGGAMRVLVATLRRHIPDTSRDVTDDVSGAATDDADALAPTPRVPQPERPPSDRPSPTSSPSPEVGS